MWRSAQKSVIYVEKVRHLWKKNAAPAYICGLWLITRWIINRIIAFFWRDWDSITCIYHAVVNLPRQNSAKQRPQCCCQLMTAPVPFKRLKHITHRGYEQSHSIPGLTNTFTPGFTATSDSEFMYRPTMQLVTLHLYSLTRTLIIHNTRTQTAHLCFWTIPQHEIKMSRETLLWLQSTGSARL